MLTVYLVFVFAFEFTPGSALRLGVAHEKDDDNSFEGEILSDLKLPVQHENHNLRGKKHNRYREVTNQQQSLKSDSPYSQIPASEFYLDDATVYFDKPKKTTKKDLGQADNQANANHLLSSSNKEASAKKIFEKCRELLETEHLRAQWESTMKFPLPEKPSRSGEHEFLLRVCQEHLGLVNHQDLLEKKLFHATNTAHSHVGEANQHSGAFGPEGHGGHSKKGNSENGNSWEDKFAFQNFDDLHLGNLGIGGQGGFAGNAGFNGEGDAAGNVGVGGNGGLAGNLGVGGKGGLIGNLGIGGKGGLFGNVGIGGDTNQFFDYFSSGGGAGNFLSKLFSGVNNRAPSNERLTANQGFSQNENDYFKSGLGSSLSDRELGVLGLGFPQAVGSAGFAGQGTVAGNLAVDGCDEQYGNVGVLGMGGLAGNVVVGGSGDKDNSLVAGQEEYLANAVLENNRGSSGNLVLTGSVPNFLSEKALESSGQKVARNDDFEQDSTSTIRCYVGALAHGGKGGQIGNLAINTKVHPRSTSPCHSDFYHVYLLLNSEALNEADYQTLAKLRDLRNEETEATSTTSPHEKTESVLYLSKFRPIGPWSRRVWNTQQQP